MANEIQALGNVVDRVIHYANGAPSLGLAMDQSFGGDGIIVSADIQSVADLAGKTVGLDKSSSYFFFWLYWTVQC